MNNNIVIAVPKNIIQKQIERLREYIRTANEITSQSTLMEISQAETRLHRAGELFTVLWEMKVLPNWMEVEEDLNRIGSKICSIRAEKHRNYRPEVRRS